MILPAIPTGPLARLGPGRLARVVEITGSPRAGRRLADLGLRPGAVARVVSGGRGAVVVRLDGGRVAVGHDLAARILVEALDGRPV